MAKVLGIPTARFTREYCVEKDGHYHLRESKDRKECMFLDGKKCSAYEGRPSQCRTWPFWPENMSPRAWQKEVASYCPGVGKGKVVTADEIRERLRESE